jgi:hypothetical protein
VQKFVMRVQLNVKSIRTWNTAKNAQKHAANVLLSAARCNQLKSPTAESHIGTLLTRKTIKLFTIKNQKSCSTKVITSGECT